VDPCRGGQVGHAGEQVGRPGAVCAKTCRQVVLGAV